VRFERIPDSSTRVRPNLRVLGPRLGKRLPELRRALDDGEFTLHDDGGVSVLDLVLTAEEVLVDRSDKSGWTVTSDAGVSVALNLELTDDLLLEGRVNDAVHDVNKLRKEQGLGVSDRIELWLPRRQADLIAFVDRFAQDNLAVRVEVGDDDATYRLIPISAVQE
jgi:isoleucyl-tRNA synthetase